MNGKHELTIKNCKPEDMGKYMFVAKEAKCEALVTVMGKKNNVLIIPDNNESHNENL